MDGLNRQKEIFYGARDADAEKQSDRKPLDQATIVVPSNEKDPDAKHTPLMLMLLYPYAMQPWVIGAGPSPGRYSIIRKCQMYCTRPRLSFGENSASGDDENVR
jgi:hypothetical protein